MGRIRLLTAGALACGLALLSGGDRTAGTAQGGDAKAPDKAAVDRARNEVKMLDTLYKTAVVSVNNRYEGPPAIKVAKDVFGAMERRNGMRAIEGSGA